MPEDPDKAAAPVAPAPEEHARVDVNDDAASDPEPPSPDDDAAGPGSFGPEFDYEAAPDPDEEGTRSRLLRFTRRLLDPREVGEDAKHLVGSVLETSDRAKSEVVKLVAREVRNYLDELRLAEDLRELMTGHTLKVSAEFTLIPHEEPPADLGEDSDGDG